MGCIKMEMFMVVGLAVVAASLILVIRQKAPEHALLLSVAAGLIILFWILKEGVPVFEEVQNLFEQAAGTDHGYVEILFKALGICFVVQIACDACRDMGESAIASKVEMAGKLSILVLSLPLFQRILTVVAQLIG